MNMEMGGPQIPKIKENTLERKEDIINPKIITVLEDWGLEKVEEMGKGSEGLNYHNEKHTKNVDKVSMQIVELFDDVSRKDKQLLSLASIFHDVMQEGKAVEIKESEMIKINDEEKPNPYAKFSKTKLMRVSGENERKSAEKLCKYMDQVNIINPGIFTEEDKQKVTKMIMMTVAGPTKDFSTIENGLDKEGDFSPMEISLALADLCTVGKLEPKDENQSEDERQEQRQKSAENFTKEGDRLFVEENIDIKIFIKNGVDSNERKEYIKDRIVEKWGKFQITFAEGRKILFEKELLHFPENKRDKARNLFGQFDDKIKLAKETLERRRSMSFEDLIEEIYGVKYFDRNAN